MPKMQQTVTATTTQEITIAPKLRLKLLTKFKLYEQQKLLLDSVQEKLDAIKAEIAEIRDETGETSLELDGYKTTLVAGERKKFNPKKFIAAGGDLAIYQQAIEIKLNKPYEKVSGPWSKRDAAEDE